MTDVGNNGIYERGEISRALDLDGAVTDEAGPEDPEAGDHPDRDTDGSLVGDADARADEAAGRGETLPA
jgi:hypothetical protein